MAKLDLDAWIAAQEHPELTVNGRTYTGRILSIDQFTSLTGRLNDTAASIESRKQALSDFLYAIFPRPTLAKWKPDPVKDLLKHPGLPEFMNQLFMIQLQALSPDLKTKGMTGTSLNETL